MLNEHDQDVTPRCRRLGREVRRAGYTCFALSLPRLLPCKAC